MRQQTEVRPRLAMLGAADLEYLHEQTLKLLWDVGVRVGCRRALELLEQAGAAVDRETMLARLPGELVESAIAAAPTSVLLAARDPEKDALLDKSRSYATNDGMGSFTLDYRTGRAAPVDHAGPRRGDDGERRARRARRLLVHGASHRGRAEAARACAASPRC